MLQTLFNSNKLQYVYIKKEEKGRNVAGSMTISTNIEHLRYLSIDNAAEPLKVVLDISTCYPVKL